MIPCFVINHQDYIGIDWHRYGFMLSDRESAEVLFAGIEVIDDDYLRNFISLKIIASRTTNRDSVISDKVPVVFLGKEDVYDVGSTAEFTILLILMLFKRMKRCLSGCLDRYELMGEDLQGKKLAVCGYGRLGKMVGRIAVTFGMDVLPYTRHTSSIEREAILRESDVVSLHLPAKEEFRNFINDDKLSIMKKSVVIVNTSRPYMVNKHAILWALENNRIGGAALDYLGCDTEDPDVDLVEYSEKHSNLILTPHLGGNSKDAMNKVAGRLVDKAKRYYDNWVRAKL